MDGLDDDLNYIENELANNNSVGDFSIKAKWGLGEDPSRLMEVSTFFNSPDELEQVGITIESRVVLAYSPSGHNQLKNMGFSHKEIVKEYGK
jgi:hypothetical protein